MTSAAAEQSVSAPSVGLRGFHHTLAADPARPRRLCDDPQGFSTEPPRATSPLDWLKPAVWTPFRYGSPRIMVASTRQFAPTDALIALLTIESLLFVVFGVTLSFGTGEQSMTVVAGTARRIAVGVAVVLTILSVGAATAWVDVFLSGASTHGFAQWCPAVAIAVGVVTQPVFAWIVVRKL